MSQNQQIKKALNRGEKVTPITALKRFGCFRLSARISNLRDEGMKIKTKFKTVKGKTFAEYSI